ncbi:MAG: hypothetical protein DCC71_18520 [Proteobacteria bacterium]|nr:MAG: hypothetical protein DCC71_18520 [Pseudomonadota bacterium]
MPSDLPDEVRDLLALVRRDRRAAGAALGALPLAEQVAIVCSAPVARRGELLDVAPQPERIVPALPEAELVFTVKAIGRADAAWLLAHATDDQLRACVDLDAWRGTAPDRDAIAEWLATMAEADDDTLLRGVHALDPELVMLWLHDRIEVQMKPNDDPGWQPPGGGQTVDGQFYVTALRGGDDADVVMRLLGLLFESDYWFYFRLLQAVIWELPSDNEEWALRWRTGRMQDLGFPALDEALAIYARPRRDEIEKLPATQPKVGEWHLPVFLPELPATLDDTLSLFRAAAELDDDARRRFFYAFVALANQVAVADGLALGDAESIPKALDKAAALASRGLDHMAERHVVAATEILRRVPLARLFRIGAHLDRPEGAS